MPHLNAVRLQRSLLCREGADVSPATLVQRLGIPAGPLRHFVYHVPARRQYLTPAADPPELAQVGTHRPKLLIVGQDKVAFPLFLAASFCYC